MSIDLTKMPKLGFGLMRLPEKDGEIDLERVCHMADAYIQAGMNYFDTAYVYHGGNSEKIVKEVLSKRYPRDKFMLATKHVHGIRYVRHLQQRPRADIRHDYPKYGPGRGHVLYEPERLGPTLRLHGIHYDCLRPDPVSGLRRGGQRPVRTAGQQGEAKTDRRKAEGRLP